MASGILPTVDYAFKWLFGRPVCAEACQEPLQRWCYFLKHGATLDLQRLPATVDVPEIRRALEVLSMLSKDKVDRQIHEDRLKAQRDAASLVHASEFAEARGVEQGLEHGVLIGQVQLAQRLLKLAPTPAAELWSKSVEDLEALATHLKQQLQS